MFLYDHVLTHQFIFVPGDTTKFFFLNWTNTQQAWFTSSCSQSAYVGYICSRKKGIGMKFFLSFFLCQRAE